MSGELDFGLEPEPIAKLFKSDFGVEPRIWQELDKGLADRIAQVQGAKPPPSQQPTAVHEAVPKPSPLHQRIAQAKTQQDVTTQAKNHPMVQAATQRLNNEGIQVEDKMPDSYTAGQRAQAIHHVANGVSFMHQQFPGMSDLAQRENLKYTLQGPQKLQGGELMGMYHGNEEQPRIEINNAAEQTLWHEHAHFLDHAITGYDSVGTRTLGHPLRNFTTELQRHPVRTGKAAEELAEAQAQSNQELAQIKLHPQAVQGRMLAQARERNAERMNHLMYRHQPEEVFARFFNSHMHYLHQKHGKGQTSEAYEPEYNENWLPEHHEHFGPKLREILRQHELTRSFAEALDSLNKALIPSSGESEAQGTEEKGHSDSLQPHIQQPYVLTKALEETRQGRPLPGTQRAVRTPSAYKIPRKITRPGVRGSTLWWYDEKGNVRYGPKPVQKGPPKDEPQHVKDMLQSERPWSFMSAHSDSRPPDQNEQAHAQLGKELQSNPDYEIYPSKGYYADEQGQLREETSYLVLGMTTKSAIPIGRQYGQNTVLTHHGMFDLTQSTLAPIRYKRIEMYDLPKDVPQTVVMTQPNHVTVVVQTGQPVPFGGSA